MVNYYNQSGDCVPCPNGARCIGGHFAPIAARGYGQLALNAVVCNTPGCSGTLATHSLQFFSCSDFTQCVTVISGACSCPGGIYAYSNANFTYESFRCQDAYANGSALCSVCDLGNASRLGVCQDCK